VASAFAASDQVSYQASSTLAISCPQPFCLWFGTRFTGWRLTPIYNRSPSRSQTRYTAWGVRNFSSFFIGGLRIILLYLNYLLRSRPTFKSKVPIYSQRSHSSVHVVVESNVSRVAPSPGLHHPNQPYLSDIIHHSSLLHIYH